MRFKFLGFCVGLIALIAVQDYTFARPPVSPVSPTVKLKPFSANLVVPADIFTKKHLYFCTRYRASVMELYASLLKNVREGAPENCNPARYNNGDLVDLVGISLHVGMNDKIKVGRCDSSQPMEFINSAAGVIRVNNAATLVPPHDGSVNWSANWEVITHIVEATLQGADTWSGAYMEFKSLGEGPCNSQILSQPHIVLNPEDLDEDGSIEIIVKYIQTSP